MRIGKDIARMVRRRVPPVVACLSVFVPYIPFCNVLHAQRQDFLGRSEVVLCGGGMSYIGDLNNQSAFGMPHAAFGIGLRERLGNRWALRVSASAGKVACDHDYLERRNLSFRSDIYELAAVAEFNFRPYGPGATESQWTPYLFGGLGVFRFNPMASYVNADGAVEWVELQPLCTEGQGTQAYPERRQYSRLQVCLPFGMGVRLRLGKSISVAAEYGFRKTWTDYLDDVSTTYVGADVLRAEVIDGDLAARMADRSGEVVEGYVNTPGIKRGDDSLDDWYSFFNLSIGFSLETLFGWMRNTRCEM